MRTSCIPWKGVQPGIYRRIVEYIAIREGGWEHKDERNREGGQEYVREGRDAIQFFVVSQLTEHTAAGAAVKTIEKW